MWVGELFAGIGGFGLAATRAGMGIAWAVEIDPFAKAVYRARLHSETGVWPDVREFPPDEKHGPMGVDVITAGFPCQDVSVAGKRKGLVGERSGLFWEVIRVARRLRPRWLLLENVPGLFSSHRGRDFETVLAALDELGYGVAWRVLDAQFFGLAQRRERVFLVGHLGGPCPAEVLFEPESVSGDSPQGQTTGEGIAFCLGTRSADGRNERGDNSANLQLVANPLGSHHRRDDLDNSTYVTHTLSAEGADASEDGTGRGTPIVADGAEAYRAQSRPDTPVEARFADSVPVMFGDQRRHDIRGVHRGDLRDKPCLNATNNDLLLAPTLRVGGREQGAGSSSDNTPLVAATLNPGHEAKHSYAGDGGTLNIVGMRPRRLTPRECERLQGFPDDWTLIPGASDSARYRVLGNAVAVPVAEWILRRMAYLACGVPGGDA